MKKQDEIEGHIQAFESDSEKKESSKVSEIVKVLEKSLDVNHFLNTRFNSQNAILCERLLKIRKQQEIRKDPNDIPANKRETKDTK